MRDEVTGIVDGSLGEETSQIVWPDPAVRSLLVLQHENSDHFAFHLMPLVKPVIEEREVLLLPDGWSGSGYATDNPRAEAWLRVGGLSLLPIADQEEPTQAILLPRRRPTPEAAEAHKPRRKTDLRQA